MQRRSTTIFVIGLLTLVLGAATTFAALKGNKKAGASTKVQAQTPAAPPGQPTAFTIPAGKQALAVALDSVAGTAGTASAGSHINVFAAVTDKSGQTDAKGVAVDEHAARMVLQDVVVLSVNNPGYVTNANVTNATATRDSRDTSASPGTSTTYVLAVTAEQAEKIVFHASFSKLWFSVLPAGAKPVAPTPGVTSENQLNPVAAV